jgi:[ribosomal protein S5]-alanine N-acetyltransferase
MHASERTIVTDRLILRPLSVEDAAGLYPIYSDPETMLFWGQPHHEDAGETRALIERDTAPERSCWWAIWHKDDDRPIGVVGYLGNPGVPGMGYILHRDYWRKGYMSEATSAAINYGFEHLKLDRVELWIVKENMASRRLAERLGFTYRGRFRQKYLHEEHSHEKLVYGLHLVEWRDGQETQPEQIYSLEPVLKVADVQATAEYYRDKLGFTISFLYGDPPVHGAVSHSQWTAGGAHIQLSQAADGAVDAAPSVDLYLFVGEDIDILYNRYQKNGVEIAREPQTHPWGMREFAVRDCNGYILRFGTPA